MAFFRTKTLKRAFCSKQLKDEILSKAVENVKYFGFSKQSIIAAVKDMNYPAITADVFPNPAYDLVRFFVLKTNAETIKKLTENINKKLSISIIF